MFCPSGGSNYNTRVHRWECVPSVQPTNKPHPMNHLRVQSGCPPGLENSSFRRLRYPRPRLRLDPTTPTRRGSTNRDITRCSLLGGALAVLLTAAPPPRPRIAVLPYNYAAISAETIANAKHEADLIYARMGVEIESGRLPNASSRSGTGKSDSSGPYRFEVRLLPHSMADRLKLGPDEIGRALIAGKGPFGTVSDIFTDHLMELTSARKWAAGQLLGCLMAHELGHLLLGPGSHSNGGIMRIRWGEKDLNKALQRQMLFTPRQADEIRKEALVRMVSGRTPPPRPE